MSKDKFLIFGRGFIGDRLREEFGCPVSARKIFSFKDAQEEIDKFSPSAIINCIGHTGLVVDDCEKNIEKTLISNAFVPLILAEAALRNRIRLVHISSGCIYHFDYSLPDKPIVEDRIPDYFDLFYSRTKIYSERSLDAAIKKGYPILIARIRIPLDNRPHQKNILTKLINYKKVIDIPNSITYIPDFICGLKYLIRINAEGIFNMVNKGALRYPELMDIYKKYTPSFKYKLVDYEDLHLTRTNLVLSTKKLENTGFKVRDIHEVLEECVQNYIKY
jgi:3,5-epimerase/4-reductase